MGKFSPFGAFHLIPLAKHCYPNKWFWFRGIDYWERLQSWQITEKVGDPTFSPTHTYKKKNTLNKVPVEAVCTEPFIDFQENLSYLLSKKEVSVETIFFTRFNFIMEAVLEEAALPNCLLFPGQKPEKNAEDGAFMQTIPHGHGHGGAPHRRLLCRHQHLQQPPPSTRHGRRSLVPRLPLPAPGLMEIIRFRLPLATRAYLCWTLHYMFMMCVLHELDLRLVFGFEHLVNVWWTLLVCATLIYLCSSCGCEVVLTMLKFI